MERRVRNDGACPLCGGQAVVVVFYGRLQRVLEGRYAGMLEAACRQCGRTLYADPALRLPRESMYARR